MHEHDEQENIGTGTGLARRAVMKALVAAPVVSLAAAHGIGRVAAQEAERGGPEAEDLDLPAYNSTINILDNGPANPYGSAVRVTGVKGFITDVNLILKGFRHDRPSDVAIMLSHAGRASIVMREAGGSSPVRDANVLLNDSATAPIPGAAPIEGGRAYQPFDYSVAKPPFGGGAPGASTGSPALSVFKGLSPNGEWVLWVRDNLATIGGSLAGWQLVIVTDDPAGTPIIIDNYRTRADRTLRVSRASGLLVIDGALPNSSFRVKVATKPKKGRVILNPDGSFTYKPKAKRGKDSFTYTFQDEFGSSVEGNGEVRIRIDPVRKKKKNDKKNKKRNKR